MMKSLLTACMAAALFAVATSSVQAQVIKIAYGQAKPPFVSGDCNDGLEVRLANELFKRAGLSVRSSCLANKRMIKSYISGKIDAGVTVPDGVEGMYYTSAFSGFKNFAITRTADGHNIESVTDLANLSAIAWNNAAEVLGPEFKAVMDANPRYEEATTQIAQVKKFLAGRIQVVIIDESIFRWLTKQVLESGALKNVDTDFTYHPIFPGILDYYIGFSNKALRDRADAALISMRHDGTYKRIVDEYLAF